MFTFSVVVENTRKSNPISFCYEKWSLNFILLANIPQACAWRLFRMAALTRLKHLHNVQVEGKLIHMAHLWADSIMLIRLQISPHRGCILYTRPKQETTNLKKVMLISLHPFSSYFAPCWFLFVSSW